GRGAGGGLARAAAGDEDARDDEHDQRGGAGAGPEQEGTAVGPGGAAGGRGDEPLEQRAFGLRDGRGVGIGLGVGVARGFGRGDALGGGRFSGGLGCGPGGRCGVGGGAVAVRVVARRGVLGLAVAAAVLGVLLRRPLPGGVLAGVCRVAG